MDVFALGRALKCLRVSFTRGLLILRDLKLQCASPPKKGVGSISYEQASTKCPGFPEEELAADCAGFISDIDQNKARDDGEGAKTRHGRGGDTVQGGITEESQGDGKAQSHRGDRRRRQHHRPRPQVIRHLHTKINAVVGQDKNTKENHAKIKNNLFRLFQGTTPIFQNNV